MVRDTTPISSLINTKLATEPITIVEIQWLNGTIFYADKNLGTFKGLTAANAKGCILELSNYQIGLKSQSQAQVNSVSVSLDDIDNSIKTIFDTDNIQRTTCKIYQGYIVDNDLSDTVLIFTGEIVAPIKWSEGERTISFDISTPVEDKKVGFSISEGEMTYLPDELIGKPWPLCFGSVLRVPALKFTNVLRGVTQETITKKHIGEDSSNFATTYITNGRNFPQNVSKTIVLNGLTFQGRFNKDLFTFESHLIAKYENIALAPRPEQLIAPGTEGDADANNNTFFWIAQSEYDAGVRLKGLWCRIGNRVNKCISQIGNKCGFRYAWDGLYDNEYKEKIYEASAHGLSDWGWLYIGSDNSTVAYVHTKYEIPSGSQVYLNDDSIARYVVNIISSDDVLEILSQRSINGRTVFVSIPSHYYEISKNFNTSTLVTNGPEHATVISFSIPLDMYENENWDEQIYVSLKSSVANNTADIIKYLIDNYSELISDTVTFAAVNIKLTNYPSNFALLREDNLLTIIEDIAWQARCGLSLINNKIYIKYLSEEPSSVLTIDESMIANKSINISTSDIMDMVTRFIAIWNNDYSTSENKRIIIEKNIDIFGYLEQEFNFWIYNNKECVQKSADFWSNRYGNCWKIVTFVSFLNSLKLEPFDCCLMDLKNQHLSTNDTKAIVTDIEQDTNENTIQIIAWLPILSGEMIQSNDAWLIDTGDELPIDPTLDIEIINYEPEILHHGYTDTDEGGRGGYGGEAGPGLSSLPISSGMISSEPPPVSSSEEIIISSAISSNAPSNIYSSHDPYWLSSHDPERENLSSHDPRYQPMSSNDPRRWSINDPRRWSSHDPRRLSSGAPSSQEIESSELSSGAPSSGAPSSGAPSSGAPSSGAPSSEFWSSGAYDCPCYADDEFMASYRCGVTPECLGILYYDGNCTWRLVHSVGDCRVSTVHIIATGPAGEGNWFADFGGQCSITEPRAAGYPCLTSQLNNFGLGNSGTGPWIGMH